MLVSLFLIFAFVITSVVPVMAFADEETPGQKPMNFNGAYLTTISNNSSTTGSSISTTKVPVKPLIKVEFDKNIVNDAVWENNKNCFSIKESNGTAVPVNVSRISDQLNFNERNNVFVAPVNNLKEGSTYSLVVSPELKAKNGYSTLGMTTGGQPVTVNFTTEGTQVVPVTGVTLNKTTLTLTKGQKDTGSDSGPCHNQQQVSEIGRAATPSSHVNNGEVTAVAPGKATITVTTVDGNKTATVQSQ